MASRRAGRPRLWVYLVRPSRRARAAASWMQAGVGKSGSPTARWMMWAPSRSNAVARSSTSMARKGWISSARLLIMVSTRRARWLVNEAERDAPAHVRPDLRQREERPEALQVAEAKIEGEVLPEVGQAGPLRHPHPGVDRPAG